MLSNSFQQTQANFSPASSGNGMPSISVQRMNSQMIPTPGFNNNSSTHSYLNTDTSNSGGRISIPDSGALMQETNQKLHVNNNSNSRMVQILGNQTSSLVRSNLPPKSYGFSNGTLNSGLGAIGSGMQLPNVPNTSESFLANSHYMTSPKPLQNQIDQYQRQSVQGMCLVIFCSLMCQSYSCPFKEREGEKKLLFICRQMSYNACVDTSRLSLTFSLIRSSYF